MNPLQKKTIDGKPYSMNSVHYNEKKLNLGQLFAFWIRSCLDTNNWTWPAQLLIFPALVGPKWHFIIKVTLIWDVAL